MPNEAGVDEKRSWTLDRLIPSLDYSDWRGEIFAKAYTTHIHISFEHISNIPEINIPWKLLNFPVKIVKL